MRLLLDTHTYLWAINLAELLSSAARASIDDPANELYLSVASLWEATIKIALGKLRVPGDSVEFLLGRLAPSNVRVLAISAAHLVQLQTLPSLHRDPFDRIMVA